MKVKFSSHHLWMMRIGFWMLLAGCSTSSGINQALTPAQPETQASRSQVASTKATPEAQNISDPHQILSILTELRTSREQNYLSGNGWQHVTRDIVETSGSLRGSAMEWWIHTDPTVACPEVLLTISDDGKTTASNLVLSKSSHLTQEIQPDFQAGSASTRYIEVNEQSCAGSPEISLNDIEQSLQKPELIRQTSFEAALSEKDVVLVMVNTDAIRHQRTFTLDRVTGYLISEVDEISNIKDGTPIGRIRAVYSYMPVETLPDSIRSEFSRALAEIIK